MKKNNLAHFVALARLLVLFMFGPKPVFAICLKTNGVHDCFAEVYAAT